jgi:hypothetical protein
MSRAFVSENDAWEYCRKAGEHCMMAEKDKECASQDCPHTSKIVASVKKQSTEERDKFVRVIRRK